MKEYEVDLILHDGGELNYNTVSRLCRLQTRIISLGSSVTLWEAARKVPEDIVIIGTLPISQFFMDSEISLERIRHLTADLNV